MSVAAEAKTGGGEGEGGATQGGAKPSGPDAPGGATISDVPGGAQASGDGGVGPPGEWGAGGDLWMSPGAGHTGWPRIFHCDPSCGAYLSLHVAPTSDSDRVGTVFAGDELWAVGEKGNWIQVWEGRVEGWD